MFRNFLLVFFLLWSTSWASDDLNIEIKMLKKNSMFHFVENVVEARTRLTVKSEGYFFLKRCFKEHRFNLPFTPKTVSYKLEKNIQTFSNGKSIRIKGLMPIYAWQAYQMKQFLDPLCSSKTNALVMIKGKLQNGKEFLSHFDIRFDILGNLIFKSNESRIVLSTKHETSISVHPTRYAEKTWERIWEDLDPKNTESKKNY